MEETRRQESDDIGQVLFYNHWLAALSAYKMLNRSWRDRVCRSVSKAQEAAAQPDYYNAFI